MQINKKKDMKPFADHQRKSLLRRFHAMLSKLPGGLANKGAILSSYGVDSAADLNIYELTEACIKLDKIINPDAGILSAARKRAIASIGGYLRAAEKQESLEIIRGIACRSTGYDDFNKIPLERLRNLYYTFANKQKDIKRVDDIAIALSMENINKGKGGGYAN